MGAHISKIKHLKLDQWEDSQVARMKEVGSRIQLYNYSLYAAELVHLIILQVGNINAKLKYEQWVPPSYRRVDSITPQVHIASHHRYISHHITDKHHTAPQVHTTPQVNITPHHR